MPDEAQNSKMINGLGSPGNWQTPNVQRTIRTLGQCALQTARSRKKAWDFSGWAGEHL